MLDENKILNNEDLVECMDDILSSIVKNVHKLDEKEIVVVGSLVCKEHIKFLKRIVTFYSKMHDAKLLLENDKSRRNK